MPAELPVPRVRPNKKRTPGNDPRPLREVPMEVNGKPVEFASRAPYSTTLAALMASKPHEETESVEDQIARAERLWAIIDGLEGDMRKAATLMASGANIREIAAEMDMTPDMARGLKRRTRVEIRKRMNQ